MNPNIPLRNLFYVASLYTRMVGTRNEFSSQPVSLPRPYFVVFYNGTEEQPERRIFRLSDLYEPKTDREMIRLTEEQPELELKTLAININKGYNEELKKSCRDLYGYMVYVDKVREFAKEHPLEKAVEMAITYCIQNDILAEFLSKRRAEVMSMSIFEYNQEEHFRQIAEENQAEGAETATLSALRKLIQKKHMTTEEALDFLEIPKEEWEKYIKMLRQ